MGWPASWLITAVPLESPDAVVSLASHEWERLPIAAAVARSSPLTRILLTVPVQVNAYNCHDCAHRIQVLKTLGVEPERVALLNRKVTNTWDEAHAVLAYAREHDLRRILIVTSPYHTRRALQTFRAVFAGRPETALGIESIQPDRATQRSWWLHGYDRWYVGYELAALVRYRLQHDVRAW
jgi:uncharacterized SAM-binding protein YcdF (DUF218 family)